MTRFRSNLLAFSVLLVMSIGGCAGPRLAADLPDELPAGFPHHTAGQIIAALTDGDTLQAFSAKASVALRSPEQSGSFAATLRSRKGDSLFMSLSPGLGIEAARILVTPDSFFLYNRIQRELLLGSVDDAGAILPEAFTSEDLFYNLLGIPRISEETDWMISADSLTYRLTSPEGDRAYLVDPALWRVLRYEEQVTGSDSYERRTFSDFDRMDGVLLPRRVLLQRPADGMRVQVYYREMHLNPSELSFSLDVRDGVERRPLPSH